MKIKKNKYILCLGLIYLTGLNAMANDQKQSALTASMQYSGQISKAMGLLSAVFSEETFMSSLEKSSNASDATSSVNVKKRKQQRKYIYQLALLSGEISRYELDDTYQMASADFVKVSDLIHELIYQNSKDLSQALQLYVKLFGEKRLQKISNELNQFNKDETNQLEILKYYIYLENTLSEDIIL